LDRTNTFKDATKNAQIQLTNHEIIKINNDAKITPPNPPVGLYPMIAPIIIIPIIYRTLSAINESARGAILEIG
jgi:hypothetical protein